MKEAKTMKSFRLSETTIKELKEISESKRISQADLIAILIHLTYVSGNTNELDNWCEIARISG